MHISDWSSDVCSADLRSKFDRQLRRCNRRHHAFHARYRAGRRNLDEQCWRTLATDWHRSRRHDDDDPRVIGRSMLRRSLRTDFGLHRSEEHTSELQSLMRISYAVFCLKKKNTTNIIRLL